MGRVQGGQAQGQQERSDSLLWLALVLVLLVAALAGVLVYARL